MFALLAPHLDSLTPVADRAGTPAGASGAQNALAPLTSLAPGSSQAFRSDSSAVGLLDGTSTDEDSLAAATDSFFAGLTDDAPVED